MRRLSFIACILFSLPARSQNISNYFESIRNNSGELTAFFSQMPKGGDLHHHYSGSVYAESYIKTVVDSNYFINKRTLQVMPKPAVINEDWATFRDLKKEGTLPAYVQKLMQKWSVKDYNHVDYPSDKQFFETFPAFNVASSLKNDSGLLELKRRAVREHVQYIETMFTSIRCDISLADMSNMNMLLRQMQDRGDKQGTMTLLDSLYTACSSRGAGACAERFNREFVDRMHTALKMDDKDFTIRYQNYVVRAMEPLDLFRNLVVAFESASKDSLVVGVNIVAPEDGETSMRDYWLHMQMFRYCHIKYPEVKYSMHAGELTLGLVKPEELSWHINAAVRTAKANRIGHGVDLAYEHEPYELLDYMREHDIPIEINLYSNEFILKVKGDRHPIRLYRKYGVPIVICTDDAGVLRSNLTEQYVLLAKRYKDISYKEIKSYVYNSIKYSFIEDPELKKQLIKKLDADFRQFEQMILAEAK
jgi:adenosine deaminase